MVFVVPALEIPLPPPPLPETQHQGAAGGGDEGGENNFAVDAAAEAAAEAAAAGAQAAAAAVLQGRLLPFHGRRATKPRNSPLHPFLCHTTTTTCCPLGACLVARSAVPSYLMITSRTNPRPHRHYGRGHAPTDALRWARETAALVHPTPPAGAPAGAPGPARVAAGYEVGYVEGYEPYAVFDRRAAPPFDPRFRCATQKSSTHPRENPPLTSAACTGAPWREMRCIILPQMSNPRQPPSLIASAHSPTNYMTTSIISQSHLPYKQQRVRIRQGGVGPSAPRRRVPVPGAPGCAPPRRAPPEVRGLGGRVRVRTRTDS